MTRGLVLTAVLALAMALPATAGQVKHDPTYKIKLTFPDDWAITPGEGSVLFGGVGISGGTPGACSIAATANEKSKGLEQDAINEVLKDSFGPSFWQDVFKEEKNVAVEAVGVDVHKRSGLVMQFANVAHDTTGAGAPARLKMMNTVLFAPGYNFALVCGTDEAKFAEFKPVFNAIRDSFGRTTTEGTVENTYPGTEPAIAVMPVSEGPGAAALPLVRALSTRAKALAAEQQPD